jgi:hypothetical protein
MNKTFLSWAFNPWINTFISISSAVMCYNRFISATGRLNTAKRISDFAVSSLATIMQQHIASAESDEGYGNTEILLSIFNADLDALFIVVTYRGHCLISSYAVQLRIIGNIIYLVSKVPKIILNWELENVVDKVTMALPLPL